AATAANSRPATMSPPARPSTRASRGRTRSRPSFKVSAEAFLRPCALLHDTLTLARADDSTRTESTEVNQHQRRARRLLNRLRHAHCNGDDVSDDEPENERAQSLLDGNSVDIDHGYQTDTKQQPASTSKMAPADRSPNKT